MPAPFQTIVFFAAAPFSGATTWLAAVEGRTSTLLVFAAWVIFALACALAWRSEQRRRALVVEIGAQRARLEIETRRREQAEAELRRRDAAIQERAREQEATAQERVAFERRLLEAQKLESLGVLAGGIAHDFNNLLTGILGNASIARLELPSGNQEVRSALDNLEKAALRAADLCKQMLAYAGKGRFVVQPLSLSRIVRDTQDLFALSVGPRAAIQLELGEKLPAVQGDAAQLRQMLMNLVINAAEAIGEGGGTIAVRTHEVYASDEYLRRFVLSDSTVEGRYVLLEVSDTGRGMDAATLSRIFDPFFTTKFTGRGLGLAAVLGIVRGHKGGIQVESEPGRGTVFRILLPAMDQRATPPSFLTPPAVEPSKTASLLLVDDDDAVREISIRILRNAQYEVAVAEDGQRALEVLRGTEKEIALVLLDLTMPRMDGEEALRAIRALRPDQRVVIMSGYSEQDTAQRFVGLGVAGYLSKPFTAAMLLGKVREVLGTANAGA